MRPLHLVLIIGSAVLLGLAFFKRPARQAAQRSLETARSASSMRKAPTPASPTKESLPPHGNTAVPAPVAVLPPANLIEALSMFSELKTHPLPTENEKAQIANLINRNSIGDVKDFLLSPAGRSVTADIEQQHQRAVSFLLEAWKMEPELVRAVAREVILDGQLENVKIPMAQRELMAKDKAEIMYHFLAMDAQLANEITPAKLTPSAQAILSKVRHEHRLNLAQSGLEVSKFQAGQW